MSKIRNLQAFFRAFAATAAAVILCLWLVLGIAAADKSIAAAGNTVNGYSAALDNEHNILCLTVFGREIKIQLADMSGVKTVGSAAYRMLPPDVRLCCKAAYSAACRLYDFIIS